MSARRAPSAVRAATAAALGVFMGLSTRRRSALNTHRRWERWEGKQGPGRLAHSSFSPAPVRGALAGCKGVAAAGLGAEGSASPAISAPPLLLCPCQRGSYTSEPSSMPPSSPKLRRRLCASDSESAALRAGTHRSVSSSTPTSFPSSSSHSTQCGAATAHAAAVGAPSVQHTSGATLATSSAQSAGDRCTPVQGSAGANTTAPQAVTEAQKAASAQAMGRWGREQ